MTTIKSYTDLSQSKKLVEILPIESADMYYWCADHYPKEDWIIEVGTPDNNYEYVCAWSLAVLLSVLPPIEGFRPIIDLDINLIRYEGNYRDELCFSGNNLVDTCYELILKLHELNFI